MSSRSKFIRFEGKVYIVDYDIKWVAKDNLGDVYGTINKPEWDRQCGEWGLHMPAFWITTLSHSGITKWVQAITNPPKKSLIEV